VQLFVFGGSIFEDLPKPSGQDKQFQNTSKTSMKQYGFFLNNLNIIENDFPCMISKFGHMGIIISV